MKFSSDASLLDELARPECAELRNVFRERNCRKGENVFHPNMDENLVMLVQTGRYRVFLAYEDKEFTITTLGPGDVYTSHTGAYVTAQDEGTLLITETLSFQAKAMDSPVFTKTMVRVLGQMLKGTFGIIDSLAFRDVSSRLASFLLNSARDEKEKTIIRLDMTGEELAQSLGTSRQTVSTLLSDMVRAGTLHKLSRGVYRLDEPSRLLELVE